MQTKDMPLLGYGTFPLQSREARDGVAMVLELGCRHLDTAQMYGNEAEVGRTLRDSGVPREDIFLTTKVHPDHYAAGDFERSVERSLRALGVDGVDLLLLHWPHPRLPMEAVLGRLMAAREAEQARTIGVSNFGPDDLRRAQAIAGGTIACNQIELHPFLDQSATIEAARALKVRLTAYCPVARGKVAQDATLQAIGEAHGRSAVQIALAWLMQKGIAVIPMTRSRAHALANLESRTITLGDDEMARIDRLASADGKVVRPAGLATVWGQAA